MQVSVQGPTGRGVASVIMSWSHTPGTVSAPQESKYAIGLRAQFPNSSEVGFWYMVFKDICLCVYKQSNALVAKGPKGGYPGRNHQLPLRQQLMGSKDSKPPGALAASALWGSGCHGSPMWVSDRKPLAEGPGHPRL